MADDIENAGGVIHSPLVKERLKELLMNSILYTQPHNYTELLNSRIKPAGPSFIRKVEEYIEANADESLRVGDLASQVGVSIRSLQAGFQRYRQKSVSEFIKEMRLRRAHQILKQSPHLTVTYVAYECGYNHQSQFAADYKKTYHESPSETRRKFS
jgi:transcriptional regulator GlxA family with amidase domain